MVRAGVARRVSTFSEACDFVKTRIFVTPSPVNLA